MNLKELTKPERIDLLSSNVLKWNILLKETLESEPGFRVDLTEATLADADLNGANLTNADLTDVYLMNAKLKTAILINTNLKEATLDNADLTWAVMLSCDLTESSLRKADLTGANLKGSCISCADLTDCCLEGTDLSQCDLTEATLFKAKIKEGIFISSNLSNANLRYADLSKADLTNATCSSADFQKTNLSKSNFCFAEGKFSDFAYANLSSANFTDANFENADFFMSNLSTAVLSQANLSRASLSEAIARDCQFSNANLEGAILVKTDLRNADLYQANLCNADLTCAVLTKANLNSARLHKAKLYKTELQGADLFDSTGFVFDRTHHNHKTLISPFRSWFYLPKTFSIPFRKPAYGDPWTNLVRAYTGSKLLFNVLFLIAFLVPVFFKGLYYKGLEAYQQQSYYVFDYLSDELDDGKIEAKNESTELNVIQGMENRIFEELTRVREAGQMKFPQNRKDFKEYSMIELIIGAHEPIWFTALTCLLLLYNLLRGFLTWRVGALHIEEERCGVSPAYEDYHYLSKAHFVMAYVFWIATAYGFGKIGYFLCTNFVYIQASG